MISPPCFLESSNVFGSLETPADGAASNTMRDGGNLRVRWEPQKSCTFIAVSKFCTDPKVTLAFSKLNSRGSEYYL